MLDLDGDYTQAALGELVGVSQQAVGALVAAGRLPAGGSLRAALLAYCSNLREQASGRAFAEGDPTLVSERALLTRIRRQREELHLQEHAGKLIRADDVRQALGHTFVMVRDGILNVPSRLSAKLAAESDERVVYNALYEELHQALTDLATAPNRVAPLRDGGEQGAPRSGSNA